MKYIDTQLLTITGGVR